MDTFLNSHLKHFQEQYRVLTSLSEQLIVVLEVLKMTASRDEAYQLKQQCSSEPLKVLVVGKPGRGKSTVINALLKEKLLPTNAVPLLYEVKWGRERKAVLHYRLSGDGSQKKAREIPLAELENYLDIDGGGEDLSEYVWAELRAPLPLCEAGLQITNLAGPYDDDGELEVCDETLRQALSADAILFVLGCDSLPSREELLEIDRMKRAGHKAIFFLCNRFDRVEPSIREIVRQRFITHLASLTPYGEQNVFFINAKGALAGYSGGDSLQLRQSDLPQVEDALYIYLAYERGQERLSRSATRLAAAVQSAMQVVSISKQLMQMEREEFQARHAKAIKGLEQLDSARQHLITLFTLVRRSLKENVRVAAANFYLDIADIIEGWPQVYYLQQLNSPWEAFAGNARERQVKELTAFLSEAVQDLFEIWMRSTLLPLLQERLSRLGQELHEYTGQFASDLKAVCFELSGKEVESGEEGEDDWEARKIIQEAPARIAGAVEQRVGFVWHSITLISRFLKLKSIQRLIADGAGFESIQAIVGQEYRHELQASNQQRAQEIVDVIDHELRLIQEELDRALGLELQNVRDVLDAFTGEDQRLLMDREDKLSSLSCELDDLRTFLKWYRFGLSP